MADLPKNPLSGINFGKKQITDADGNVLLKRKGIKWSEDDQMGFDLLMQSLQNDYQIGLLQYENEYNSASEQAKRMREAGLNPDLLGTSGERSSDSGQNVGTPGTILNEGLQSQRFTSQLFDAFTATQNFISSYSQFQGTKTASDAMRIDNASSMNNLALEYVIDKLEPRSFKDGKLADDKRFDIINSAPSFAKSFGLTKSQARHFQKSVASKVDSPDFIRGWYGAMNQGSEERLGFLTNTTGPLYSDMDEVMRVLLDEAVNLMVERDKSSYRAETSRNVYDSKFYDSANPYLAGKNFNIQNDYDYKRTYNQSGYISRRHNTVKKMKKLYDQGNQAAGIYLGLLSEFDSLGLKPFNFTSNSLDKAMNYIK